MFGFTEHEMEMYQDAVQAFAIEEVATNIVENSKFVAPATEQNGKIVVSDRFVQGVFNDVQTVITITAAAMAYEYAFLQDDGETTEEDTIAHLHTKYESHLIRQFINYSIVFTEDVLPVIVSELVMEMPYLYAAARSSDEFDDELFLEERLAAYTEYLDSNFYEYSGLDDYEDFDEDEAELNEDDFDE
ncbi:hypothetical protein CPT_Moonbeam41 [Bacillus phage Moonbeam]|uniref:Uncharacterized protein n=1 Tax=Bacillus phage Moonbeam TaxID=1540091 RepID=A0A0A0RP83_9CAUD|nr:hypothetical protein CPT_Moonbeam41 [Bacillus phage Moonbeam]AIW03439.1 hypothetical protein CPT_Moonbeam41 [Bacillus phage Moonbeam]